MGPARLFIFSATMLASATVCAQSLDDDLRIYAVSVVNIVPFKRPFSGYGIYLGQNAIITAAHVVGHWSLYENPIVRIDAHEIPGKIIKKGAFPDLDLALLVVGDESLPVSLRLRRNPLCKTPPEVGMNVIVVYPDRTVRSQIISTQEVAPQYRNEFNTLIAEEQGSGSGVFDPNKKCLLGIMSAALTRHGPQPENIRAGYFVPVSKIANFIPAHLRF